MPRKMLLAMLLLALPCLALLGLALPGLALAANNPFLPQRPFATAEIKYQLKGNEAGTAVLYLDGQRSARHVETTFTFGGTRNAKKSVTITLPDKVIEVDLIARTAKATGNMNSYLAQEYEKLSPAEKTMVEKNAEKLGASLAQALAGAPPQTSQGTFKGKPVDIVTVAGVTSYTWKDAGIPLKTQGALMGIKVDEEAVSIETGAALKPGVFEVPAGIAVTFDKEEDQMQRQMAGATLAMLKDPQFESKRKQGGPAAVMMAPGLNPGEAEEADEADEDKPAPPPVKKKK
jgi:hypothetical protein